MKFTEIRPGAEYAVCSHGRPDTKYHGLYKARVAKLVPPRHGAQGEVHVHVLGYMDSSWDLQPKTNSTMIVKSGQVACEWRHYLKKCLERKEQRQKIEMEQQANKDRGKQLCAELNVFLPPEKQVTSWGGSCLMLDYDVVEALLKGIHQSRAVNVLDFL